VRVFLSYTHEDKDAARAVQEGLIRCGFDVWSDAAILPGESVAGRISEALEAADAFVVLIGSRTYGRQWSLLEIGGAIASRKPLIPIVVGRDVDLPLLLRDRQYLDFTDPSARAGVIERLCAALRKGAAVANVDVDGVRLVQSASQVLRDQVVEYESEMEDRHARAARRQVVLGLISSVIAAVSLILVSVDASSITTALIAGLVALLASTVGFYAGSKHSRQRQ
jgi:TIR domain